jgi:hypothetical protein
MPESNESPKRDVGQQPGVQPDSGEATPALPPPAGIRKKTALGCAIVAVPLLLLLGLLGILVWFGFHPPATLLRINDSFLSWLDRRGKLAVEATAVILPLYWAALCLSVVYGWFWLAGKPPNQNFRWLNRTLAALVFAEATRLSILHFTRGVYADMSARHHTFVTVMFRTDFVIALLIVGLGLYAFKQQSKLLYGCSEIIVGVIGQLKVITDLDLSQWPHFTLKRADAIAIAGLTYVLSRGVSNVVEGLADEEKKAPQASQTPTV